MALMAQDRLHMAVNGVKLAIGPEDAATRASHEALVAADYDRCHPDDTFEAMKLRARFSKEDQGLLSEWMALAAARAGEPRHRREPAAANPHSAKSRQSPHGHSRPGSQSGSAPGFAAG